MPRRERRSVGAEVLDLAQALSDDLLVLEEKTFAALDAVFVAQGLAALVACQKAAVRSGLVGSVKGGAGVKRVMTFAEAAVTDATLIARDLLTQSSEMVLESIGKELELCESTLSVKYVGCADAGVAAAVSVLDAEIALSLSTVNSAAVDVLTWMEWQAQNQFTATVSMGETADVLWNRLFNEKPNRISGLSGRGVWWQMPSTLRGSIRGAEFRMVNSTRNTAMIGMNEAGASRG